MSYEIVLGESFKKDVKHYKRHFPSVAEDIKAIGRDLQASPTKGDVVPGAKGVRKVRVENSDMNKGKVGSYRLLYYVVSQPTEIIYLLMLYAKNERGDVPAREIIGLLKKEGLIR